jgi:hypothetical protein
MYIPAALVLAVAAGCAGSGEIPADKAEDVAQTSPAEAVRVNGRHVGYYYPQPVTTEQYKARSEKLARANRVTRLAFVTGITKQQRGRNYPPRFAIFAKGDAAEKLIIVGLDQSTFSSLYRARAALAQMTAMARLTPLFKQLGVQDYFTFFDLVKMLGFESISVSDGETWSHRIDIL